MSNSIERSLGDVEELLRRTGDRMFRAALAATGSRADAEDILQDAFVRLLEKRPAFASPEHETAWLMRVTVNLARSRLRSPWRGKTVPLPESYPARTENQQTVLQDVLALPAKYRIVIHLFYYEGFSTKEIAVITRQKESTVREQLTRARRKLRIVLEGERE